MVARSLAAVCVVLLIACYVPISEDPINYVVLTMENRTSGALKLFAFSRCDKDEWTEVVMPGGSTPPGSDVSVQTDPGCYDVYVKDEFGCFSYGSSGSTIGAGVEQTWTVKDGDLVCL